MTVSPRPASLQTCARLSRNNVITVRALNDDELPQDLETVWAPRVSQYRACRRGAHLHGARHAEAVRASRRARPAGRRRCSRSTALPARSKIVGGILLLFGLFTRPVAFILSGEMAFAYWMGHAPRSFYPLPQRRRRLDPLLLPVPLSGLRGRRRVERWTGRRRKDGADASDLVTPPVADDAAVKERRMSSAGRPIARPRTSSRSGARRARKDGSPRTTRSTRRSAKGSSPPTRRRPPASSATGRRRPKARSRSSSCSTSSRATCSAASARIFAADPLRPRGRRHARSSAASTRTCRRTSAVLLPAVHALGGSRPTRSAASRSIARPATPTG